MKIYLTMTVIHKIVAAAALFQICLAPFAIADDSRAYYYLDKMKMENRIIPLVFIKAGTSDKTNSIRLDRNGLFQEENKMCSWSLNGGSHTKKNFSLDGNFAVPILDPSCEAPFSHHYTGIGFGDWYLTLHGTISNEILFIRYRGEDYYIPLSSLKQWTRYTPGEFPIKGDKGD
ncbi:hypothetical protein ACFL6W_05985 [Thermodesulfobacteriota bacterium]